MLDWKYNPLGEIIVTHGYDMLAVKNTEVNVPEVIINKNDLLVLDILAKFTFLPKNLMEQWVDKFMISEFINIGLIWLESTPIGEFYRPFNNLFKLTCNNIQKYFRIDFQVRHTLYEAKIAYEVMSGKNETILQFCKNRGFADANGIMQDGCKILIEKEFNNFEKNSQYIIEEFKNSKIYTHTPDLVLPDQMIAIEVELSTKTINRYMETLKLYKNSNYKLCIWLCKNDKTIKCLNEAKSLVGINNCLITKI